MDHAIEISQLKKSFRAREILRDINLIVNQREFVCLLGPSGSGKSTLLRLIAGLEQASAGELKLATKSLGFVFQEPSLLDWRTVEENIRLPLEIKKRTGPMEELISLVGLSEYRHHYPSQLSGGMKMRTSLARALVDSVKILLLDEPFSALDEPTRHQLQVELRSLAEQRSLASVFVTHSLSEAAFLADRVVILSKSGQIQAELMAPKQKRDKNYRTSSEYFAFLSSLHREFSI